MPSRRRDSRAAARARSRTAPAASSAGAREASPGSASSFVRWMIGGMIWRGRRGAGRRTRRGRSTTRTLAASSAGLRWISSVAIDFAFTARRQPAARAIATTSCRASSASRAQCTSIPWARAFLSNVSSATSRCARTSSLAARAWSRTRSAASSEAKAAPRRACSWPVARSIASCRWTSPTAARTRSANGGRAGGGALTRAARPRGTRAARARAAASRRPDAAGSPRRNSRPPRRPTPRARGTCGRASRR